MGILEIAMCFFRFYYIALAILSIMKKYHMHLVSAHKDYITAEINDVDRDIENLSAFY